MDGVIVIEVVAAVMESLGSTGHPNHGGQQQNDVADRTQPAEYLTFIDWL
jgi:hypothetical protein